MIPVKNAICHPDYDSKICANDIMLLQVGHMLVLAHSNPRVLHPP